MLDYTALAKARAALAECVALQAKLDAKLREAAAALGVPEASPDAAGAEPSKPKRVKRWSKETLDRAIRQYVSRRSKDYKAVKLHVSQGFAGSENTARRIFGRNIIARRVKASPSSVGQTSAWREIQHDLFPGTNDYYQLSRKRKPVDFTDDMKVAVAEYTQLQHRLARENRVIDDIRKTVTGADADRLIERLTLGEITPVQAEAERVELKKRFDRELARLEASKRRPV